MPFEKDYSDQAKVVKYLLTANKELAKLQKEMTDGDKEQAKLIREKQAEVNKLNKYWKDNAKVIKATVSDYEDMDDTMVSIGNSLKKNNKFVDQQSKAFAAVKIATTSIAMELSNGAAANKKTQAQVEAASNAYKSMHTSIAQVNKEYALGKISNQERISQIKEQSEAFKDVVSVIDMSTIKSEDLTAQLSAMGKEAESFAEEMKNSQMQSERLDNVFDSFSGIPALGEVNTLLKTNIKDTVAFKAAVFALGAALGKAAMDYFGAPIKAAMQADKEIEQGRIDGIAERAKMQSDAAFIDRDAAKGYSKIQEETDNNRIETAHNVAQAMNEAAFAGQKAANAFSASMQQGAAQFNRAAKTALFGKSIGSIGYGAAQMQLAGIGADKIASAMESAGAATGKMPTAKAAADMAVMAERTGQSVDDISTINEAFQRMDGMSANVAMNMQEGMRNMADQAGIGLGNLMKEVAESSKEALGYQIKSGPALAKAVAYTQSMGLNFGDVAKAGKSMVMNYKDSIKAEMQLSSLLGEQVDLSEVRAKFAAGDQAGALESLKAQGLDPADMDMFQQEALQSALGGMDLNSLSKVAQNTGKSGGDLKAGDAKKGNQGFLTATQQAEASLNAQEASISANQAVIDAKLSGEIAKSFINSDGHKQYLKDQVEQAKKSQLLQEEMDKLYKGSKEYREQLADTAKLNFVEGLKENLLGGLAAVLGGLATTGISSLAGKVFGKKGGGGGAPEAGGGGGGSIAKDMAVSGASAGAEALVPGSGAVVESVAANVEAIEAPLEKAMSMGDKIKDLGAGLGGFIQKIGQGVGTAIKAVLQGIGQGLLSVAAGLVALTPAIPVMLAFGAAILLTTPALMVLAPVVIEIARVIGDVLVKALEMAGPIITSILEGIGYVIKSIGEAISMVITSVADSLVKIGGIDGTNLLKVAAALIPLSAGLLALGAAELINGVMGFISSLFGGKGPTIWEKLKELGESGPGLMQAASAVSVLAPAFAMLSQVDDGKNLGALMDNLKSALTKLDDKAQATLKGLAGAMHDFGYGAYALGVVRSNPNLELLAAQIQVLLSPTVTDAITKGTPIIQGLQTTLTSFATSTRGLADSLGAANPQLMQLLGTMQIFSAIASGIDVTSLALINMASALSEVAKIDTTNLSKVPWEKMAGFSKQNGNFVLAQSANNNFTIAQDSAKNIEKLTADSKAQVQIAKNLQALLGVLAENKDASFQLNIDGGAVTRMIQKRQDDRKNMNPKNPPIP